MTFKFDGVSFEDRCFFCGVPFTNEEKTCNATVVCQTRKPPELTEFERDKWSYLAAFVSQKPIPEVDIRVRQCVKGIMYSFIFSDALLVVDEYLATGLRPQMIDPTPLRLQALFALSKYWGARAHVHR